MIETICVSCDELGPHGGRRLCHACYQRHHKAGTLEQFPKLQSAIPTLGRIEDYAELRSRGLSVRKAAIQLGVTARSGQRYEARLKARDKAIA